ncbi:MAG: response regulator [Kofleriaceae bacterium]|nr:response regulator [Kofleriaceae bacterium]
MSDGTILVVDDDPLLRGAIAMILEDEGYTVELASDGIKALEAIAANKPDMILLDMMMPNMSGTQVLRELQESERTSSIPVIIMTAINGVAGGRVLNGDNEIVEKPFEVHDLLNKIALTMYRTRNVD